MGFIEDLLREVAGKQHQSGVYSTLGEEFGGEENPAGLLARLRYLGLLSGEDYGRFYGGEKTSSDGSSYAAEKAASLGIKVPGFSDLKGGQDRVDASPYMGGEAVDINTMLDNLYSSDSGSIQFEGLTPDKIARIREQAKARFGEEYTGGMFAQGEARGLSAAQQPGALEAVMAEEGAKDIAGDIDYRIEQVFSRGPGPISGRQEDLQELKLLYQLKEQIRTQDLAEQGLGLQHLGLGIEAERVGGLNQYYSGQVAGQESARGTQLQIAMMEAATKIAELNYGGLMTYAAELSGQDPEASKTIVGLINAHGDGAGPMIARYLLAAKPELLQGVPGAMDPRDANAAIDQLIR